MVNIPRYQDVLWPAVVALRDLGGSASISELDERLIANEGFSDEQQAVLHGDGPGSEIAYRIAWARTYLKGMGLADNSSRAVWSLTEAGRSVTREEIEPLRQELIRSQRKRVKPRDGAADDAAEEEASWQDELLEALLQIEPAAFERLCQRLLREAGFSRTQVTGRTGDGGIDGLGTYRLSLVSFQVFFQAKRWRNSVGAKEVRDFRGAMSGRGEKGLLITTASFTADAKAEASRDGAPPVDLVDGAALCELLARYEIGVRVRERTVLDVEVDHETIAAL
ncbi:MAG: restriction endonuclease [Candidatus Nanopelagicales bacterium]